MDRIKAESDLVSDGDRSFPETSTTDGKTLEALRQATSVNASNVVAGGKSSREEMMRRKTEELKNLLKCIDEWKRRFPEKADEIEEKRIKIQEQYERICILSAEPPEGLDYFPGMVQFTDRMRREYPYKISLVKRAIDRGNRITTDETIYDIYVGQKLVGQFTIRRPGDFTIERNIFMKDINVWGESNIISFGYGGTLLDDFFRQVDEWFKIQWESIRKLIT